MIRHLLRILPVVVLLAGNAAGDGKMFTERVPPDIPYQRALILFDDGVQTLLLQSKYEFSQTEGESTLGWVVPVPAVPELASMPDLCADKLFLLLSMNSRPNTIWAGNIVAVLLLFLFPTIALVLALFYFLSRYFPRLSWCRRLWSNLRPYRLKIAIFYLVALIFGSVFLPALGRHRGGLGVDIVHEQQVGIYDVHVITGEDSLGLIEWLNKKNFAFDENDVAAFDDYIRRGWCFVVARVKPDAELDAEDGLVDPLIMRFPVEQPVYPLALTGTGGHDTKVLLYILAQSKMTANGKMTLRHAGHSNLRSVRSYVVTEPPNFFDEKEIESYFLTKFRDTLSPSQMAEDIYFSPAPDDTPYRKTRISW